MERFCFPPIPFHTRPVCCTKRNECEGVCTLSSAQRTKKRSTLRSTETALFRTEKSKTRVPSTDLHPKWFALFCTEKSKPGVPSTDLHPKWLSFHLLSLSRRYFHSIAKRTRHTHSYTTIIMAGEEETETFAFQAEINQLLSLIINVRFKSALVLYAMYLFQRASYSFPAQIFSSGHERFFSRLFVCAMTLTRFSL